MENSNVFSYQYSAKQNREVEHIRRKYLPKEENKMETLRKLDAKVKRPANVFAYTFGSISAIVMGAGMSLVMTDIGASIGIGDPLVPGIIIGVVGMAMALINYPIHRGIINSRKKKYAPKIIALSEKIMGK